MTSDEEIESNAEREDSNQVYAENSQEKEDIVKAISKDQESESTQIEFDPLLSFISLNLKQLVLNRSQNIPKPQRIPTNELVT